MKQHKASIILSFLCFAILLSSFSCIKINATESEPLNNADALTNKDRIYEISLVWNNAYNHYGQWGRLPSLDWNTAFIDSVQHVIDIEPGPSSGYAYLHELLAFYALLENGHGGIRFKVGSSLEVTIEYTGGKYYVVDPKGTGIPRCSEILAMDGIPMNDYLADYLILNGCKTSHSNIVSTIDRYLINEKGTVAEMTVKTPEGVEKTVPVAFNSGANDFKVFHNRRKNVSVVETYNCAGVEAYMLECGIVYIYVSEIAGNHTTNLEKLIKENTLDVKATGFIIDFRRCGGGNSIYGINMLALFTDFSPVTSVGQYQTYFHKIYGSIGSRLVYEYDDLDVLRASEDWNDEFAEPSILMLENRFEYGYGPGEYTYGEYNYPLYTAKNLLTQPVVLLAGSGTECASETMLDAARASGRFLILGTPTFGSLGNAWIGYLPMNGSMQIPQDRSISYEGFDISSNGVQPHIWCEESYEDMLENRDTQLLLAMGLINLANDDAEGYERYLEENEHVYDIKPIEEPDDYLETVFDRLHYCGTPDGVLTDGEKIIGLAEIWRRIQQFYYGFEGMSESTLRLTIAKWNAAYKDYIVKVLETADIDEYYDVLSLFIALLDDPGTYVVSPGAEGKEYEYTGYWAVFPLPECGRLYITVTV